MVHQPPPARVVVDVDAVVVDVMVANGVGRVQTDHNFAIP
jgi:hypothetical protein